jgi:hypothetical protein
MTDVLAEIHEEGSSSKINVVTSEIEEKDVAI